MNFDHLRELNELFEDRRDALILACLARGVANTASQPPNLSQLAILMIESGGSNISEGDISRSLLRLREARLVAVENPGDRNPVYSPTPLGHQKITLLTVLIEAIADQDSNLAALDERLS